MKEEKDIEQLFRSSFEEFEVTPPPGVRDAIARRIASVTPWYGKPWLLLSVAAIAITGTILFFLAGNQSIGSNQADLTKKGNVSATTASNSTVTGNSGKSTDSSSSGNNSGNENQQTGTTAHQSANTSDEQGNSNNSTANTYTKKENNTTGGGTQNNRATQSKKRTDNSGNKNDASGKAANSDQGARRPTGGNGYSGKRKGSAKKTTKKNEALLAEFSRIEEEFKTLGGRPVEIDLDPALYNDPEALAAEIEKQTEALRQELADIKTARENEAIEKAGKERAKAVQDSIAKVEFAKMIAAKQDSIAKANADSVKNEQTASTGKTTPPAPKKTDDTYNWRASFYGAILPVQNIGIQTMEIPFGTYNVESRSMLSVSAEIQRLITGKWTLSSGINYTKRAETFSATGGELSIYQNGYDSIPVMQGDTVIGYEYVENYDTTFHPWTLNYNKMTQSFGIPLFIGHSFEFGKNWGAEAQLGAVVQFYKVTSSGDPETVQPNYTKVGLHGYLRLSGNYTWNRFVFSAGLNTGYDFKPSVNYDVIGRKILYFGPQLGLHYRF